MGEQESKEMRDAQYIADLRKTLELFDEFRSKAPMREIADEINPRLSIFRSELSCLESIQKVKKLAESQQSK